MWILDLAELEPQYSSCYAHQLCDLGCVYFWALVSSSVKWV